MRSVALGFLLLLAACNSTTVSAGLGLDTPGLDVAQAALRGGSPQIALQVVSKLLAKDPGYVQALVVQGEALTALGRLDEADASFSAALQRDPDSVAAHIGLGRVRLATNPASAEEQFLVATQRDPRNAIALNDLGIARDLQGRHADAQAAYREALAANPNQQAAQVNLALSLAMTGQSGDAIKLMRPLADKPGASPQLRHDYAAVLTMAGDKPAAERILSADLTDTEVQQAMAGYAAAGQGGNAAALLTPSDPVPATPAGNGGVQVQLAAAPSESAAQAQWQRLQSRLGDLFATHAPNIVKVEQNGRSFWRLRTGGFDSLAQATAFCERVRSAGADCMALQ